jgi:hypothetical protein
MSGRERTSGPRLRQPAQRPVQSVLSGKRKVSMARQAGTRMKSRVMSFMISGMVDTLCCRIDGEGKYFLEDTESYIHVVKLALWTEHRTPVPRVHQQTLERVGHNDFQPIAVQKPFLLLFGIAYPLHQCALLYANFSL